MQHPSGPFAGGGPVGEDLARVPWAATPLGEPATWPQSLVTMVQFLLTSRFSMWMAWGPELTFFCNQAYRDDTLGGKYPWALGRPASEVWAEIWPDIGPRIDTVLSTGEATWDEGLLLFLERAGYREETYHTFSYSPLREESGAVAGMFCVVSEDTERVLGARRLAILRDLGAAASALGTEAEMLAAVAGALERGDRSLPFTATYLRGEEGLRLAASSGFGRTPAPSACAWPLQRVLAGEEVVVDLAEAAASSPELAHLPAGGWDAAPTRAVLLPLRLRPGADPVGAVVLGTNPHRALDASYRSFLDLVASQVATGVASARAYEAERERAEQLAELDRAKTRFFTNVSHEFRTPLTLMLGPAEDALADRADPLAPSQRRRVELVERNGQRLLRLVNALLDLSRLESGRTEAVFGPVDLAAYTASLAGSFTTATERVGLALEVDCPPLGEPVWVDQEMWAKIVLNLLSNALKFTPEGGVAVRLRREGPSGEQGAGWAVLEVSDSGIGIADDDQDRLFERFSQVAGAPSRSHEGSGIGLALVAELTAEHGGAVEVRSAPGRGSSFVVRVPLGWAHLPAERVSPAAAAALDTSRAAAGFLAEAVRWSEPTGSGVRGEGEPAVEDPEGAGARVLVVDDNADMREHIGRLLSGAYDVVTAADGQEGLQEALRHPPDLVLTDVMMPRLDGFGLLTALRREPVTASVPVVMVSARAGQEATVGGLEAGADDYLVKPFTSRELLARVRANLELDRVRRGRSALQRTQGLLDQAQRLAATGSWEVDLRTGVVNGSVEFLRQLDLTAEELAERGLAGVLGDRVHPEDLERVSALWADPPGDRLDYQVRITAADGALRTFRTIGELVRDPDGAPAVLRGSNQDVTDQLAAEERARDDAASRRAAAREHQIADELQRSLLPQAPVHPLGLRVATYYRAGVEGTQVGGDWFDVIDLGAGRTALVLGDVMGRGVRAAAVMGQLRTAARAYARLDLPPAEVLERLDDVVRELGDDQIVTCVYAVHDAGEEVLAVANAGHLPPLLRRPGEAVQRVVGAEGSPLGTVAQPLVQVELPVPPGSVLALYTDGLVEHRDSDLDAGIDALAAELGRLEGPVDPELPSSFVDALLPDGPDDDVAVLVVQVDPSATPSRTEQCSLDGGEQAVGSARRFTRRVLADWGVDGEAGDDVVLMVSELVTNAVVHGRGPVLLRLRESGDSLDLEVRDSGSHLPRRRRADADAENGRGLQLVTRLSERWGTRPTGDGKAVWASVSPLQVSAGRRGVRR